MFQQTTIAWGAEVPLGTTSRAKLKQPDKHEVPRVLEKENPSNLSQVFQIRNPKHQIRNEFKYSKPGNVQNGGPAKQRCGRRLQNRGVGSFDEAWRTRGKKMAGKKWELSVPKLRRP
jgi:hypothetical protein